MTTIEALNRVIAGIAGVLETGPDAHTKAVLRAIFRLVVDERKRIAEGDEAAEGSRASGASQRATQNEAGLIV